MIIYRVLFAMTITQETQWIITGVLIVLLIMVMVWIFRCDEDTCMKGFWKASHDFCDRAQLVLFLLRIGDAHLGGKRDCYLLAQTDNGIILNNAVTMTFSGNWNLMPGMADIKNYDVHIDWLGTPPDDPSAFPSQLCASYYPKHSKLILHSNDEVLAALYKDTETSALEYDDSLTPDHLKTAS